MTDLKPCPFCGGTDIRIEGKGQLWRGVKGYSDPQFYELFHTGPLPDSDGFQACIVHFRVRTEAEAIAAWNTRAKPKVKPLVWEGPGHWHSGDDEGWMEEAITPFGWGYAIEFGPSGGFLCSSTFEWSQDGFETPDAAKAAAQADYERRILEALE